MKAPHSALLISLGCLAAAAQTAPPTIRVTNEIVPAGGIAQMKVLMTSPNPITSGNMAFDLSAVMFDAIDGISLFSSTGDVMGAAVVNGGQVSLKFVSPNGTFGTDTDYPLMTVALTVAKSCFVGQKFPVNLSPIASVWQNLLGFPTTFEYQQGSITVGGSVAISNVVPGGGVLPAGASFRILGMGFTPNTKVAVRNVKTSSIQYVSPTEILVTLKQQATLDGTMIQVQNPDKSADTYYSYLRGVPVGQSARPLLAKTVPIFSINTATEAVLPPTISPQLNPDYFTAIALQNPGPVPANITIESLSAAGAVTGTAQIALPSGSRISREVSELLGATLPTGSYLHMVATQPVEMLGLLGNDSTGVVIPVPVRVLSAPASSAAGTAI